MKKSDFLAMCDTAVYGTGQMGNYSLEVVAGRDSLAHIGGNPTVELRGTFSHQNCKCIYSPNFVAIGCDYTQGDAMCQKEAIKYQRWLAEWKSAQPGVVAECSECLRPKRFCDCPPIPGVN